MKIRAYHHWWYNFSFLSEVSSLRNRNEEKESNRCYNILLGIWLLLLLLLFYRTRPSFLFIRVIFLQSLFCEIFFFRLLILVPFVIRSEITPKETGFIFAREEEEEWNWVIFFSRLWKLKYFGPKRSEIFMIQHPALQTISEVEKDFIYLISVCIGNYYCHYYYYHYFVLFFW